MGNERIRLCGISKSYYSKESVTQALRKVNLSFSTGEFVAITGESGSGKSTLLHMIGGMDTFDEGEMYVDGEPTFQYDDNDWEEYRCHRIGYVFQDYSLLGHYTVLDNIVGALLVMGKTKDEATVIAKKYLEQVGLGKLLHHKATELSSGQKQRLSIARALSKETGIIIADEPTGNLDSETGDQIIELLAELSKERLVIMVTHNYDQVEKYATRKIRIHDGEVISDVQVNERSLAETETKQVSEAGQASGMRRADRKTLRFFTRRNLTTQKARTIMLATFSLVIASVGFVLIGEIASHWDDIYTKKYSKDAFAKEDDTRLVAKKEDGTSFTAEEIEELKNLSYVTQVDSCDYINDVNYYFEREDYRLVYGRAGWDSEAELMDVKFLNDSRFMKSVDCITEADLTAGRMPEARNEIVLATDNEKYLNRTISFYFSCTNFWDSNFYTAKMTVVGIINTSETQAYFTNAFCHMITTGIWDDEYRIAYAWNRVLKRYDYMPKVYPVVASDLVGNKVRIAGKFPFTVAPMGEILFRTMDGSEIVTEETIRVDEDPSESTGLFLEVSQEFYDAHYAPQVKQVSLYIVSYAKTDAVLKALSDKGYYAVSTIRTGKMDYQPNVVKERLTLMAICFAGLIGLMLAQILILRALMRSQIKDFDIMKFIGMKVVDLKKVSYMQMGCISVFCTVIVILVMNVLRLFHYDVLSNMMWYITPVAYALFAVFVNVTMILTVMAFNASLEGRLRR